MSQHLLAVWSSSSTIDQVVPVLPDGCRDLIFHVVGQQRPRWFVSALFDRTAQVSVESDSTLIGFRFKPGVEINEKALLEYIECVGAGAGDVPGFVDDFIRLSASLDEALACLSEVDSVSLAANRLGVSIRTLQRLIVGRTGRSPGYWLQLARARKAARSLTDMSCFAEVADAYGFSDQAHMNRSLRRWFDATPSDIVKSSELRGQLNSTGYG